MSSKVSNTASKSTCNRYTSNAYRYNCKNKSASRIVVPKKILISKKLTGSTDEGKSSSAGVISNALPKVKKTAKSDLSFNKKPVRKASSLDVCRKCGDSLQNRNTDSQSEISRYKTNQNLCTTSFNTNNRNNTNCERTKSVQQYYMNENFDLSTESVHETEHIRKTSLNTIKELPEARTISDDTIFRIHSESESENGFLDVDDEDVIKSLKEFRNKNYFECHSARSRIKNVGSATALGDHQCVYRFYLNDRLFPVPLNTDYNNQIRCVECHLPMEMKPQDSNKINGTIQAKVKLGDELKDTMLLLPAKEPLIIKEKRTEDRSNLEEVYFGVIKLDINGNSMFGSTQPNNSFALKYQKGYKEYVNRYSDCYKGVDQNDVIVI
ncbi:hypothetical protein O3G_MSEX010516 [Manduca sexta]|uniref:Uncharacterized protein n=1 Tax=Manduca sexta TaxID=7130 RepID=A0A921ZHF5_MANSE|nr:hypothetical protein O3G_MSEX010516 [Manduca sexta]